MAKYTNWVVFRNREASCNRTSMDTQTEISEVVFKLKERIISFKAQLLCFGIQVLTKNAPCLLLHLSSLVCLIYIKFNSD